MNHRPADQADPTVAPADRTPGVEARASPRFACAGTPPLQVLSRPFFFPLDVCVRDVSTGGVGFFCNRPMDAGDELALLWDFGPAVGWRTLRARVAHCALRRAGAWFVGVAFAEPLDVPLVEAFLHREREEPEFDPTD